jgi:hypothetical protein
MAHSGVEWGKDLSIPVSPFAFSWAISFVFSILNSKIFPTAPSTKVGGIKDDMDISDIEPLKSSADWHRSRSDIDSWLMLKDYDLLAPKPPINTTRTAGAEHDEFVAAWRLQQQRAVLIIRSTFRHHSTARALIKDKVEIAPALVKLEGAFKPSFSDTYHPFSAVCLARCKDLEAYTNSFPCLYSELQDPEFEYSLQRVEQILKITRGLGRESEVGTVAEDTLLEPEVL